MGLHLKNFMKIKPLETPRQNTQCLWLIHWSGVGRGGGGGGGVGGGERISNVIAACCINITQIFESCWFARDFTMARSLGEQQEHFSLLGTS